MRPSRCHDNVEILLFQKEIDMIFNGLSLSNDGIWRPHSWGVSEKEGKIIETTTPRLCYIATGKKQAKVTRPVLMPTEQVTHAMAYCYDHKTGCAWDFHGYGSDVHQAQNDLKTKLTPLYSKHIDDRSFHDLEKDQFISLVYPPGTEMIMVYLHRPKADDSKDMEEAKLYLDKYLFYDYCFVAEVFNQNFVQTKGQPTYTFKKKGTTTISHFTPEGKEMDKEVDCFIMEGCPEIPDYFIKEGSKIIFALRDYEGEPPISSEEKVTVHHEQAASFLEIFKVRAQMAIAQGHVKKCGCGKC
jgi:hypothetical protein